MSDFLSYIWNDKLKRMKKILLTAFLFVCSACLRAQEAVFSYFTYEGNDARFQKAIDPTKEYLNPILAGFYPDPAICRKGDSYYLVNSSFAFYPAVPIFESKDLVNWTQIGHVLDRPSQFPLQTVGIADGIYAPGLSYNPHNDTFYMVTTNVRGGGTFYVKAKDPRGPWSDPIWFPGLEGIDPSFLFDDDGRAYLVRNASVSGTEKYAGERSIYLQEFSPEQDALIGEPLEVVRGGAHVTENPIWIEGPHLYHIGDYYYLMCAEGGTAEGHSEVIFRSRKPQGPWEECPGNPILTQRSGLDEGRADRVTCAGHADLVQTPEGEWWAVFLGCRPYEENLYNTGRETFLLPVTWEDGWPQILENGKAIPTVVEKAGLKPLSGTCLTGNFSYTDRFDGTALHPRWLYLRNPPEKACQLSPDGLVLHPAAGNILQTKPLSAVFCRQQHANFSAETLLNFRATSARRLAGLILFQSEDHCFVFGKTLLNGTPAVVLKRAEGTQVLIGSCPLQSNEAPLRLKVECRGRYISFYYAEGDTTQWHPLAMGVDGANLSTAHAGGFIGTTIGLYATRRNP